MSQFDDRIFKVEFTWGTGDITLTAGNASSTNGGMSISATGQKYANPLQDDCSISIANLSPKIRNLLLTQLTNFNYNQQRKTMALYAGRVSTGLFLLYSGDITQCVPSQPPDITLHVSCKTAQFYKFNILAQANAITAPMSQISAQVASAMGLKIQFEATDKNIQNYSYTGSAEKQVRALSDLGAIDCYVDGGILVVKDKGKPLQNVRYAVNSNNGMIGIPEPTDWGVRVRSLLVPNARVGGAIDLVSEKNPLLNGAYTTYKLGFQVASREVPFYTIFEATKYIDLYYNAALPQVTK
jgi:hypothetical protein